VKVKFPDCRIDILAEERNSQIFKLCSDVDQVYHYDHLQELCFCLKTKYDVVVDTEQWHRLSAVVARLIRAKFCIGFRTNERRRMFSHTVDYSQEKYELDSFLDLFSPLNIGKAQSFGSFLSIPEESFKSSAVFLDSVLSTSFIVLFPGASIPERRWGTSNFRALAGKILASGLAVVVVGGEEDVDLARDICQGMAVLNLAGKTSLLESAAVVAQSKIVVTGDSGLLHIAVGLDKPTVSLFGPGIAKKWAPRGEKHIVLNKELSCSPCTKFGNTPKCPRKALCLQQISVEDVFAAVESLS
ncbi:MAG: glycosyltransferase family 9 protein, partial [Spirochaetales bacterium]|nr:glycosyltransferase family 9 protein [Spirochaetales bacterium]